jgi:hypothetical protein
MVSPLRLKLYFAWWRIPLAPVDSRAVQNAEYSLAAGRVHHAGHISREVPNKEENSGPLGWGLVVAKAYNITV